MGYTLGVDLGTTFTAAAVFRDGRAEILSLGTRVAAIPSVVLLREDETILTGEAASRRAFSEPQRVAREFKRRLGDTTPLLVGGTPYSAEQLMSRMLESVLEQVTAREGGRPDAVALSHPANWGPYKIDLLNQAVRLADLGGAKILTEPEAAAIYYASQSRVEPGTLIAVYDLGGGTFDAAVLRKTVEGFEILGEPEGIERLGGIDFDAAVYNHVVRSLAGKIEELDEDDPNAISAVARLREECVAAKEALSADTDTTIPVLLPNVQTEVRLTRSEFEAMVRPPLMDTIDALRRALRSAEVAPEDVDTVLLVGGSSRIPVVAQLVGAELRRPVSVDTHPKNAVALGAALAAAGEQGVSAGAETQGNAADLSGTGGAAAAAGGGAGDGIPAAAAAGGGGAAPPAEPPAPPDPAAAEPPPERPAAPTVVPTAAGGTPAGGVDSPPAGTPGAESPTVPTPADTPASTPPPAVERLTVPPVSEPPTAKSGGGMNKGVLAAIAAVVLVAIVGAVVLLGGGGDDTAASDPSSTTAAEGAALGGETSTTTTSVPETTTTTSAVTTTTVATTTTTTLPLSQQCTSDIKSNDKWVCITDVTREGDVITADFDFDWGGDTPSVAGGDHFHVFGNNVPPELAGTQASGGSWTVWDQQQFTGRIGGDISPDATELCVLWANPDHTVNQGTGNCWPIPGQ